MRKIKLFLSLLILATFGVTNAWAEDYSATHTSNVTFTAGTSGSTAKVIINSVEYDAMKLGTSSKTGTMTFKIPVGTTKIHLHVAGWKSKNTNLSLSANNGVTLETTSITSTADDGVTNNSPFTLATPANATTSYYKVVEITSGATVAETTITIQTTSTGYRAVVWGVSAETESGGSGSTEPALTSIQIDGDLTNKTYEEGDELDLTGLTVLANYESGDPKDVTNEVEWSYTPNPLTKGTTSVEVTATYEDKTATQTITGLTVNEHIITPGEYCITPNNTFWGTNYTGTNANAATTLSGKQDDISILHTKSGSNLYVNDSQTRVYENHTMKISVPLGYVITAVVFTADGTNWKGTHIADVGEMTDSKTWTGANQNVTITFGGTCRITNICVTYIKDVKYALTITEPTEGGTLVVKDGENTLTSGAEIYEGTKLTVTATPETGYEEGVVVVKNASVEDITADVYDAGTLTMPAYAVTISATFEKKPCTLLTTPVVTATPTYNSATLTWEAVTNAAKYSVKVGTADAIETTETSYEVTGLTAETEYTYQVQAIAEADQDMYCDSEVAEGSFTTTAAPVATLTLSDIEGTTTKTGALNGTITLPTEAAECSKTFVGWDADENCDHAPTYAPGAEYTLAAETQTLYAVYADGESGEASLTKMTSSDALANGDKIVIVANGTKLGMYQETISTSYVKNWELGAEEPTISELDEKKIWDVVAVDGSWKLGDATNGYLYNSSSNNLAVSTAEASTWTIAWKTTGFTFKSDQGRYLACRTDLTTDKKNLYRMNGTSVSSTNGSVYEMDIYKYSVSAPTYSNYSTTCVAAPKAEVNPTAVSATAAGANDKVEVTYENVNTANVAVALYNDAACTEAFSADWLTASLDGDKNITYTVAATTLYTERKAYIKLTAPETTGATEPAVVVIPVTQAGKDKVFASLEALLAAITPTAEGVEVTVTLTNEVIQDFYTSGSYTNGIALNVPYEGGVKVIEIYCKDVPAEWVKGGKVSGTITCPWKLYNSTWELCPTAWTELTYTAPATVKSIAVSGTPTKTTYVDGEAFDPTGLVVTATLTDDSTEPIDVALVDWAFNPATLTKGETSVSVTATFNSVSSAAYEVTGLTVNDIPTKTVAEFIAAGGTRCYLEGIVSNITNTTYGNFDLTDASGKIYVYGCLNAAGESKKFAELGVKNGDKIKVIADQFTVYGGKDQATDVQYVSHISAATITIADITMEVGETKTIAATVDPAGAEVTYTIKENAANAISLSGNTITALAEGTATITATVTEGATYLSNSVDFKVTVTPKSEKTNVVILAELGGKWYAMKGAVPSGKSGQLDAIEVTYFNGTLYNVPEEDKSSITWTRSVVDGKATFVNNGKYLKGGTSTDLTLAGTVDDNCKWIWDDTKGYYTTNTSGTIRTFLYRENYNFKNYGANQAGKEDANGDYSALPVVTAPVYATGDIVYTRDVTPGNYGTICLPYASDNFTGATFFEVAGKEGDKVFFDEVTTLEAGKPYIFMAESNKIVLSQTGESAVEAGKSNSLQGTFSQINPATDNELVDNYMVVNNVIKKCGANCGLEAYRAYFIAAELETLGTPSAPVPGRRRVAIGQAPQVATGVDQVQGDNVSAKMIINGQLFILRGEKMYDAQGKLVK